MVMLCAIAAPPSRPPNIVFLVFAAKPLPAGVVLAYRSLTRPFAPAAGPKPRGHTRASWHGIPERAAEPRAGPAKDRFHGGGGGAHRRGQYCREGGIRIDNQGAGRPDIRGGGVPPPPCKVDVTNVGIRGIENAT